MGKKGHIININNLSKSYNQLKILNDLSLNIKQGEFVSFIGPSGCGKTTLLRIIGGLLDYENGEVLINDDSSELALMKRRFGIVFQKPTLLNWRTTYENIILPLQIIRNEKIPENIDELIKLVGLEDFKEHYPHELSGGMQQRVAIARALSFDPPILLMDEPFGSLDAITRHNLNLELLSIWEKTKKTIIFITHDIREAIFLSDRIFVLSDRPAEIKDIVDVNIKRPRDIYAADNKKFIELHKKLNNLLKNE